MSNGNIFLQKIDGTLNSEKYIHLLEEIIVPRINGQNINNWIFQQNNAPCHTSKKTLEWFKSNEIQLLQWPARIPDLNIIENVWSFITQEVYDGPQFNNINDLWAKIEEVAKRIQGEKITELLNSFNRRLLECFEKG